MIEVLIPSVEQLTTAKEFVIYRLVLDLNHLERVRKFKIQKIPRFFKISLSTSLVLYIFVICSVRRNFAYH